MGSLPITLFLDAMKESAPYSAMYRSSFYSQLSEYFEKNPITLDGEVNQFLVDMFQKLSAAKKNELSKILYFNLKKNYDFNVVFEVAEIIHREVSTPNKHGRPRTKDAVITKLVNVNIFQTEGITKKISKSTANEYYRIWSVYQQAQRDLMED